MMKFTQKEANDMWWALEKIEQLLAAGEVYVDELYSIASQAKPAHRPCNPAKAGRAPQ